MWSSEFNRIDEAFWFEKQIQGWGRDKRIALIEGRPDLLVELAKSRQRFDEVVGDGVAQAPGRVRRTDGC